MRIPYGMSHFGTIRSEGYFYADKTSFLSVLESPESGFRHVIFLRPRRFGKSTLVSMLEHYYDVGRKHQFDDFFKGLWVHEHPTDERSSHLVLTLDFSPVATDQGEETLRRSFYHAVRNSVMTFLLRYRGIVPPLDGIYEQLETFQDAEALIGAVMATVAASPYRMYLLIDEYDHFANRLLSNESQHLYDDIIVKRTGFVRTFYATLKLGTRTGAIARMFVTGVTPLMLDDLSSGFNMVKPISTSWRFNTLAGFTRTDVERAIDEFLTARPHLSKLPELGDRPRLFDVLEAYYDGYRFSEGGERVFNSDMVLYFLAELHDRKRYPDRMLDRNVRTDYSHLSRIGTMTSTDATERRDLLEKILTEQHVRAELLDQFGIKNLSSGVAYISLLYFLGMLTFEAEPRNAHGYAMEIPNRVIRELQWEHLALMLKDEGHVVFDMRRMQEALAAMAIEGDIEPFRALFHSEIIQSLGIKDTRGLSEKTIKLLFMMYASLGGVFHPLSEKEFAQGYCDLFLGPVKSIVGVRYSWLIEFKYLRAKATEQQIEHAFATARAQVERYASDKALLPLLVADKELKAGTIVFVGTKSMLFRPWPADPSGNLPKPKTKPTKPRARK